jgi:hypothetical protein
VHGETTPPDLRPLGVGEVLDVALKLFFRNARTLLLAAAVVVVPVQLLLVPVFTSAAPDPGDVPVGEMPDVGALAATAVASILGGIVSLAAGSVATAACFKAVSDAYLGRRADWRESLRFGAQRFAPVLVVSVLGTVLAFLALFAFIVPGVYLFVAWAVAVPVVLVERVNGFHALSRSWQLVKGRWWATFGALLLAYLLTLVVAVFIGGTLAGLIVAGAADDGGLASVIINQLFTALATVLTTPFFAAVVAVLYFDLRVRKEGFDLSLLAERVGVAPDGVHGDGAGRRDRADQRGGSERPPYGAAPENGAERPAPGRDPDPPPQR